VIWRESKSRVDHFSCSSFGCCCSSYSSSSSSSFGSSSTSFSLVFFLSYLIFCTSTSSIFTFMLSTILLSLIL
jgi:hypothetical protein